MSIFGNKKAVIIRDDENGDIEISSEFNSVNSANRGLSVELQQKEAIIIKKGVNDFDGSEVTALENLGNRLWGEIDYHVIPSSELD